MNRLQKADLRESVMAGDEEATALRREVEHYACELDTVSRAAKTLCTYRQMVVAAEQSREPLSQSTTELMQADINLISRQAGLADTHVSTESEGVMSISLEAMDEKLKKAWERIKELLAKFAESVRRLFAQFMDRNQKLQGKVADIEAKAGAGTKPADQQIPVNARVLAQGNTIPNNISEVAVATLKAIDGYLRDDGAAEKLLKEMAESVGRKPVDDIDTVEEAAYVYDYVVAVGKRLQTVTGSEAYQPVVSGDDIATSTGRLPGNVAIAIYGTKKGATLLPTIRRFRFTALPLEGGANLPETMAPFSGENITAVLASIREMNTSIASLNGYLDRLSGYTTEMARVGDVLINKTPDDKKSLAQGIITEMPNLVKAVMNGFDIPIKYMLTLGNELVTVCERSLAD